MRKKGFAGGPFQLLIGVVVFGMALVIGAYLMETIQCWKCNELLKAESIELREAINTVGNGDPGTRKTVRVEMEDLGSCAKGINIKHVTTECRSFCPNHPNNCWVIVTQSSCGDEDLDIDCIDISGDEDITADPELDLTWVTESNNKWIENSYGISHTIQVQVEKVAPTKTYLSRPG